MDDLDDMLDAIEDALEADDLETALRLARRACKQFPTEPDAYVALGDTLLDAGEAHEARRAYEDAVRLAPDSPEHLASLAWAHYELVDFDAARTVAERANARESNAAATYILGRLAERAGDLAEADRFAQRAQTLDPEIFPLPFRIDDDEFRAAVSEAVDRLPEEFHKVLDGEVAILVEPVPPLEVLEATDPPWDPEILGLYVGVPLPDRSTSISGKLPDVVYLFQRNLEHAATDREGLLEQIAITVYHEIGHYLGYDDDELDERGIG